MGRLGAHMSIAGGLHKAVARGDELGCEAIQIFVQSARTWAAPPLGDDEVKAFRDALRDARTVRNVVAHNSYLLNLSTSDGELRRKSVAYFIGVMEKCEALGIESLITHPGGHGGAGEDEGIRLTSKSLDEVMAACPGYRTRILVENTAGQGNCVGYRLEHLGAIADGTRSPEAIGVCFDTQHAFAAGYDLRNPEGYGDTMEALDRIVGIGRVRAFHLNDAMKDFNCRVDRHQNIGKGFLGRDAFRPLVNDPRFAETPMCLETAPGDEMENWREELALLRAMISPRPRRGPSAGRARG